MEYSWKEEHAKRSSEALVHKRFILERTEAALEVVRNKGDPLLLLRFAGHDSVGAVPPKESQIAHINSEEAATLRQGVDVGVVRHLILASMRSDILNPDGTPMTFHNFISPTLHKGEYFFLAYRKRKTEVIRFLSTMILVKPVGEKKKAMRAMFQDDEHGLTREETDELFELTVKLYERKEREEKLPKMARSESLKDLSG